MAAFNNTYWLLRHGRSVANEQDLVVCRTENGQQPQWGLAQAGREQAAAAGQQLRQRLGSVDPAGLLLFTSPFSRTIETALGAGAALGVQQGDARLQLEPALRERCFGDYELTRCAIYERVWAEDAASATSRPAGEGGESVEDVAARMLGLIERLELEYSGRNIVLVSHGDALSVLAAAMLGTPLGAHRQHGLPNCGILRIG